MIKSYVQIVSKSTISCVKFNLNFKSIAALEDDFKEFWYYLWEISLGTNRKSRQFLDMIKPDKVSTFNFWSRCYTFVYDKNGDFRKSFLQM